MALIKRSAEMSIRVSTGTFAYRKLHCGRSPRTPTAQMHWWLPTTSNRGNGARDQQRGRTGGHRLRGCVSDLNSTMLIPQPRIGGRATAAVIANGLFGLAGLAVGLTALYVSIKPLGIVPALALALIVPVTWNLTVWVVRARIVPFWRRRTGATRCIASVSTSGEVIRAKTLNFPETCAGDQQSQPGILRRKHLMYYRGLGTLRSQPVLGVRMSSVRPTTIFATQCANT